MAEQKQKKESEDDLSELFQDVLDTLEGSGQTRGKRTDTPEAADLDTLIEQMEKQLTDLSSRAQALYDQAGMSEEEIEEFAQNPDNFSSEEWELLTRIREKVDDFQHEAEQVAAEAGEALAEHDTRQREGLKTEPKGKPTKPKARKRKAPKKKWLQL